MINVGIDIGGMSIKVGLVDFDGKIIRQCRVKTEKTPSKCIANMVNQINQLLSEERLSINDIKGIGIGCPGCVNDEKGIVENLPNVNGWVDIPLVKLLKEKFNVPIKLSNDANVATLGEIKYGCAKNYNSCVMFTLGTGVGGGIVLNGKLYEGERNPATELGHMTLIYNGLPCTCGRKGCIERYVSATALIEQTKEEMLLSRDSKMWDYVDGDIEKVDGKTAFECAKTGDIRAEKVVEQYISYLSESIMNTLNIFRPEAFILGGGVSAQGEYLINRVKEYCKKYSYGYVGAPETAILTASLGNDAGIIGAAALIG